MDVILQANEIPPDLLEFFEPVEYGHKKDVLTLSSESYKGAHFATFPRSLVRPCILSGTSEKGCCPICGAGWVRVVELGEIQTRGGGPGRAQSGSCLLPGRGNSNTGKMTQRRHITTGWQPSCTCTDEQGNTPEPIPATVLDLFIGSGTTAVVCKEAGRDCIGIDLSAEYLELARQRYNTAQLTIFDAVPEPEPTMQQRSLFD